MEERRPRWEHVLICASLLVSAAFLVTFFYLGAKDMAFFCSQDMYSDELVARLIWEDKSLFPDGWVFGNQYNIISTPVVAALFYGLTGSMNLSMLLATTCMNVLMIAAFLWAMWPFCTKLQLSLGLMTLLGGIIARPAAYNTVGQIFYIMASYYACYMITLLVVVGDYARLITGKRNRLWSPGFVLALVLSMGTGMQSIRQTAVMVVPMVALELLRLILVLIREGRKELSQKLLPTWGVLGYSLANLAGLVLIRLLNIPHQSIYGSLGTEPLSEYGINIIEAGKALAHITGLPAVMETGLSRPLPLILCLFLIGVVGWFVLRLLYTRLREVGREGLATFGCVGILSVLCLMSVRVVLDMSLRSIYLFSWFMLVVTAVITAIGAAGKRLKPILSAGLCVLVLSNLVYTYGTNVRQIHSESPRGEAILSDWIEEQGYELLYGEWWMVNQIVPYADGAYITGSWHDVALEILPYINMMDVYTEADNERAVYLVMTSELPAFEAYAEQVGAELTLKAQFYDGSVSFYESSRQLMHFGA